MVEFHEENGQMIVRIAGQEYTRYQFGPPRWKPYLYPIKAANGQSMVADAPTDHRHHHGIWIGHARVDGHDFWLERNTSGKIVHRKFDHITNREGVGAFTAHSDWVAPDGAISLTDTRTFTFYEPSAGSDHPAAYEPPADSRTFDIKITLSTPGATPVTLHPTNEAGLPEIRAAEGLTGKTGGVLTNAELKAREAGVHKQKSPWLDSSGKLGRLECGIAVFDHPNNPQFPTPWFARDYGPFAPNYGFFLEDPIVIAPDAPLRLRYRIYTHSGNVTDGRVAEAWDAYRATASARK